MNYYPKPTLQARLLAGRLPLRPLPPPEEEGTRPSLRSNGMRIYPRIPGVASAPPPLPIRPESLAPPAEPQPELTPFQLMKAAALAPRPLDAQPMPAGASPFDSRPYAGGDADPGFERNIPPPPGVTYSMGELPPLPSGVTYSMGKPPSGYEDTPAPRPAGSAPWQWVGAPPAGAPGSVARGVGGGGAAPVVPIPRPPIDAQGRPLAPSLRRGDHTYKPMPKAPMVGPPPKPDPRAGQRNAIGSLVAGLLAGVVTGKGNAATAAMRGFSGGSSEATSAREQAAEKAYRDALGVDTENYRRSRQGIEDENSITRRQQDDESEFNAQEIARYRAEVETWDKEHDNKRQSGIDAAKQRGDLDATAQAWEKWVATLDPDAQQEEIARADRDGRLQRWGLNFEQAEDGRYISNLRAAPPQAAPYRPGESPAEKEAAANRVADRKQYETDLREQYDLFSDPRLTKKEREVISKRIGQLQKQLGFGNGLDDAGMAGILADMTPAQQAAVKQHQAEFAEGKRRTRATEAYRSQSLKQRAETARSQVAEKLRTANGKAGDVFYKNNTRLSAIETALSPSGKTELRPDAVSALELERDMIIAQQVFLAGKVPGLPKGTARRFANSMRAVAPLQPDGTPEGDSAYLLGNRPKEPGRYDNNRATGSTAPAVQGRAGVPAPAKGRTITDKRGRKATVLN